MKTRVSLIQLPPGGFFPISLGYIAASLKSHNVDTTLEDLSVKETKNHKQVLSRIRKFRPHLVGFTAYQRNIREVLRLAALIKKVDQGVITIIGGPQVTFMPKEALSEMPSIDVLCRGEGEVVLPALCDCLHNGRGMETVKSIAFKKNGTVVETEAGALQKNLDDFASPYQAGLVDFLNYKRAIMLTSRGCPFNCHFCYTPNAYRRTVRYHSAERVLEDLAICVSHQVAQVFVADPSFTANRASALKILRGIIKKRWKLHIWCETRADLVDRELLAIMAEAGVSHIAYGLETVDKKVMEAINKKIDLKKFKQVVKWTQELGMNAEVFTLYGLPQQTFQSACETLEFVKSMKVPIISNSSGQQLELYFGTHIHDQMEEFGIHPLNKQRPLYLSPATEFGTGFMNKQELTLIQRHYMAEQMLDQMLINKTDQAGTLCG